MDFFFVLLLLLPFLPRQGQLHQYGAGTLFSVGGGEKKNNFWETGRKIVHFCRRDGDDEDEHELHSKPKKSRERKVQPLFSTLLL